MTRRRLEGPRPFRIEGRASLTPSVEIGARHAGGDQMTGFGVDIGDGLAWSDLQRGLSAELRGRRLLSHAADSFRARGFPPGRIRSPAEPCCSRADLERAGGWRPLRRHVDRALVEGVVRAGGTVYRIHDAGYLLVRRAEGHTWRRDDAEFLAGAEVVHGGWRSDLAGLGAGYRV